MRTIDFEQKVGRLMQTSRLGSNEVHLVAPHTLRLARSGESTNRIVSARYIMIAVGTEATKDS